MKDLNLPIKNILIILVVGVIVISLLSMVYSVIIYPLAVNVNENFILKRVQNFYQQPNLQTLYLPLNREPYLVNPYSPLFQVTGAGLAKIFHIEPSNTLGRTISFICTILTTFFIYLLLRKYLNKKWSIFWASSFLLSPIVLLWGFINRIDMMGVLFTVAGICFFVREKKYSYFLSIVFFLLALSVKISFLSAPLAVIIYLLYKNRKSGLLYIPSFFGLAVTLFFIMNYYTQGQFYIHNFIVNRSQSFYWWKFFSTTDVVLFWPNIILFIPVMMFIFYYLKDRMFIFKNDSFFWFSYLILVILFCLSYSWAGAGDNYFIEYQLVSLIWVALSWRLFDNRLKIIKEKVVSIPGILFLFIVVNVLFVKSSLVSARALLVDIPYK